MAGCISYFEEKSADRIRNSVIVWCMPGTRFRCSAVLLLLLPTVLPSIAQTPAVPAQIRAGFDSIRESDLRADLGFVASDALQGRMSLQPGDDAAVQWIASEFAKAGLEPLATDASGNKTFLQPVPLIEYRPDRKASFVALKRSGSEKKWQFPDVLGGYHDNVDVSAPVVFAGYGITAPELHYDDYKGIKAEGKIVLVFDHEPQETDPHSIFNGTGNTRYATTRVKALTAQAHGAVAILIVAEPNRKHPSNQERVARIGGSATRINPIPGQALADDALHIPAAVVSDAVAAELLVNAGTSPSALQSAIDKDLSPQSLPLPDTVVNLHYENLSRTTGTSYNVAGLLPGSDPTLGAETILISAHHDHDGSSPNASGGLDIWHGADDNGSGTVGVVELAHAFAANPSKPKRSILFVVFAAEERGLLGAYYMDRLWGTGRLLFICYSPPCFL
jgi:hypothetical protein